MKLDPLLGRAAKLAKKRNYESAMKILRDEEDRYHGAFKYYYLCGVICLHSGAFLEAKQFFERAKKIKMQDPSTMLGLAVLYIRGMGSRGTNISQAVDYYLDVLEIDPKNKLAAKALAVIRANSAPDELADWLTPERLAKLFPPIPNAVIDKTSLLLFGGVILLGVIVFLSVLLINRKPAGSRNLDDYSNLFITSEERSSSIQTDGAYYIYTFLPNTAVDLYEEALSLFSMHRDEKAKINLNKLLLSNASEALKNRARLMIDYMEKPNFLNFNYSDNVSFEEVKNEPIIYKDVYVIWSGMAYNISEDFLYFELHVNFDPRRNSYDGMVPVFLNEPVRINTDRTLEVLGKISLNDTPLGFYIQGETIRQSGRLE